ncbi:MAG: poly(R)-hydroxyalkanoic acid synthase subunit PhaE [Pikeienuella sp.]
MSGAAGGREGTGSAGAGFGAGTDADDLLRRWMAANRSLLEGTLAGTAWTRAELLYDAWARFAESWEAAAAARMSGDGAATGSPFDPAGWLRAQGGGGMADLLRWLEGPQFAETAEHWRGIVSGLREWIAYLAAVEQMKAVLAEAWIRAFRHFAEAASDLPGEALSWTPLLQLWREISGRVANETHRSPEFLAAFRDLLAAETALRRGVRARMEVMAELVGLPTRRELDDVHRSLHALRRELRRMGSAGAAQPSSGSERP